MLRKTFAASALLLLTACGVTEVDVDAVEEDIATELEKQMHTDLTAECPDQVDWRTGEGFECDVEFDDGSTRRVNVQMVDDSGNVMWNLEPVAE